VISVIIVNWNAGERLHACLASLADCVRSDAVEVIVVDNGSTDGSVALARRSTRELPVRWVENVDNRGLARAQNQGLLASVGDVIVLANPDVVFGPGSLSAFEAAFARHPRAGMLSGRVTFPDGSIQTTAGDLPTLREALAGRQRQWRRSKFGTPAGFCWDGWAHQVECRTGRAGDAVYAVRRAAVATVGLLDERFFLDWEAVDWSARMHDAGWEIWFCPDAQFTHYAGTSTGRAAAARWIIDTHRSMYQYFTNRFPMARPLFSVLFAFRAGAKLTLASLGVPLHERALRPRAR
jgi:GT2 family glycosyltransferase